MKILLLLIVWLPGCSNGSEDAAGVTKTDRGDDGGSPGHTEGDAATEGERAAGLAMQLRIMRRTRDVLHAWISEELLPYACLRDPDYAALEPRIRETARQVSKVRGLSFRHRPVWRIVERAKAAQVLGLAGGAGGSSELVLRRLGIPIRPAANDPAGDASAALPRAFFDTRTKVLYMAAEQIDVVCPRTLVHEMVHALEDQHFDMGSRFARAAGNLDHLLTVRCLFEASAEFVTEEWARQTKFTDGTPQSAPGSGVGRGVPENPLVVATVLFPYVNGPWWLREVGVTTAERLDELLRSPPVSTEQILYPARFRLKGTRDYPQAVRGPEIAAILGSGWTKIEENTLGQLMTGVLLAVRSTGGNVGAALRLVMERGSGRIVFRGTLGVAVEGWDGDRYVAYRCQDGLRVCMVWTSVWDSACDAWEFGTSFGVRSGDGNCVERRTGKLDLSYLCESDDTISGVRVRGDRAVVVLGAPRQHVGDLFAAGWRCVSSKDPRETAGER